jgi:hypothetical protein
MSSIGLNDSAILSENFFKELFNIMYELKLEVELLPNAPAIDLKDLKNKIAFQITVRTDASKVTECKNMFEKHQFQKIYKRLRIFFVGTVDYDRNQGAIETCAVDLFDMKDLLREIQGYDLEKMKRVGDLIDQYISFDAMTVTQTEIIRFLTVDFKNTIDEALRPERNGICRSHHYWVKADTQYEDLKRLIWAQEPKVDRPVFEALDRYLGKANIALELLRVYVDSTEEFKIERWDTARAALKELRSATTVLLSETKTADTPVSASVEPRKTLLSRSLGLFGLNQ